MSKVNIKQSKSEAKVLNNRGYRLIRKLGQGSYAKVYLGEYKTHDSSKPVACKVINTKLVEEEFLKKFLPREIEILSMLSHPYIVHVHSIFQRRNKVFIFMRYAENGDLLSFLMNYGPIAESQARIWMRQIALALQYMHELGIAHRDLKCENVLVTSNYNVKVADFGFSRQVTNASRQQELSETYCGSLQYAAPEIIRGDPYYPKIADIWSLGVIMYTVLNKAMPFDERTPQSLYNTQMKQIWKFRSRVVDEISKECRTVVKCLLDPDTVKRWSIDQFLYSDWIVKDPKLRVMTQQEFSALAVARERLLKNEMTPKNIVLVDYRNDKPKDIKYMQPEESSPSVKPIELKKPSSATILEIEQKPSNAKITITSSNLTKAISTIEQKPTSETIIPTPSTINIQLAAKE